MEHMATFIIRNYRKILIFSLIITIIMGALAATISLKTSMSDLLSDSDPVIVSMKEAYKKFGGTNTIIIGIEGKRENIERYMEICHSRLTEIENVKNVIHKKNTDFIDKNVLLMSKDQEYEGMKRIIASRSINDFFGGINSMFLNSGKLNSKAENLNYEEKIYVSGMLKNLNKLLLFMNDKAFNREEIAEITSQMIHSTPYNISLDGTLGIVMVTPSITGDDIYQTNELINTLESTAKRIGEKYDVDVSLSGTLVLQRDEMVTSQNDMTISSLVSIALVVFILLFSFKGLKLPFLAIIPLIAGIVWTLGLTKIFIGYLDFFSAMMAAILVGLAIDFGVHILSTYTESIQKEGTEQAIKNIFKKSVKGIIAGGLTTAIGFTVFAFSTFQGFSNFGIVMGLGIACTIVAYLFILPALLIRYGRVKNFKTPKPFPTKWLKFPRFITLTIVIVLSIVFLTKIGNIEFEKAILKLQAANLESIKLNEKLQEKFEFSADSFFIIDQSLEEARKSTAALEKSDVFSKVDSITKLIPSEEDQLKRLDALKAYTTEISKIDATDGQTVNTTGMIIELNKLRGAIAMLRIFAKTKNMTFIVDGCDEILNNPIYKNMGDLKPEQLEKMQLVMVEYLETLRSNLNVDTPLDIQSLPESMKNTYIGNDGSIKTNLLPNGNVYSELNADRYTKEAEAIDKTLVGTPIMYMRILSLASEEGQRLFIWLLILIFIIVLIDLRNIKYAILAIIPMVLSVLFTIGTTHLLGIRINLINIITFPLIIAIGIDDGIHFIHRYLVEKSIPKTVATVGRAITITSLTTIAAFGSFVLAQYRGFQSFGLFLALGIAFAYIMTITLLPVLISYIDKKKLS